MDMCVWTRVYGCVHGHIRGHVYGHVYGHVVGPVYFDRHVDVSEISVDIENRNCAPGHRRRRPRLGRTLRSPC